MSFSSEPFTRWLILKISRKFCNAEISALIQRGSYTSGSSNERNKYFWLGSTIFTIIGVILLIFAAIAVIITSFKFGYLDLEFFFYYAPGFISSVTGIILGNYERRTKSKVEAFGTAQLILSVFIGSIISLIILF